MRLGGHWWSGGWGLCLKVKEKPARQSPGETRHQALLPLTHKPQLDIIIRRLHHIPALPHGPDNLLLMHRNIADIILDHLARFSDQPLAGGLVGFHRNAINQVIQPRAGIAAIIENTARGEFVAAGPILLRALAEAAREPKLRFLLGVIEAEAGHPERARATWRALLADSPPDAPSRALVERRLGALLCRDCHGFAYSQTIKIVPWVFLVFYLYSCPNRNKANALKA